MTNLDPAALRSARERAALRPSQVADAAGITRGFYSHLEAGHKRASWPVRARLARVLGVSVNDFNTPIETPPEPPDDNPWRWVLVYRDHEGLESHTLGPWASTEEEAVADLQECWSAGRDYLEQSG